MNMEGAQDSSHQEAARWYARLRAPDCTAEERLEFEAWRNCDPRNAAAYRAAERMTDSLAALAMTDPRLKAMVDEAASAGATLSDETPDDEPGNDSKPLTISTGPLRSRRHIARPFPWAAGLAVTALSGLMLLTFGERSSLVGEGGSLDDGGRAPLRYRSGAARHAVTLDDGTRVYLDIGSIIEVRYDGALRAVTLVQGRALFDAAHDESRPFVVTVGNEQVTALETLFQVDRAPSEVVVTLAAGAASFAPNGGGPAVQLTPGEQLRSSAGSTRWLKRDVNARTVTNWSLGERLSYAKRHRQVELDNG